jgi:acyl-coenzyme A thioesterase PaaI-like protein
MSVMSEPPGAFYVVDAQATDHADVTPTRHCAGPWSPLAQHGGPPIALMARQAARVGTDGRVPMRVTADLLGAVPMGPLRVTARVVRSGRSVELVEADLTDLQRHRVVARAALWLAPWTTGLPATPTPAPPPGPDTGRVHPVPEGWHPGYLDAIEWSWVEGSLGRPGPATVWMRPRVSLVEGEPWHPTWRLLACVDSASGASAALDVRQWQFMNTELTAHLLREPAGEWVGLRAETTLSGTAVGLAAAEVFDRDGIVARTAQALLVRPASQATE